MNNTDPAALIRQAKHEGFIRHTRSMYDDAKTTERFNKYAELDKRREDKFVYLRQNILEGLKA